MISLIALMAVQQAPIEVDSLAELRAVASAARPGTTISIAPGDYVGGVHLSELHGAPGRPIIIGASDPKRPPRFRGGSGIQLSGVSHLRVHDLVIEGVLGNGLNVDDAGNLTKPSEEIVIERITVADTPRGNHDGIKLSGLKRFRVSECTVTRWGGSAVDMVGCHEGVIEQCLFRTGGDSGVQAKGGSSGITIRTSRFVDFGQRGVNLGGSTGTAFFRPPLNTVPTNAKAEARNLRVEGCTFVGGVAPIAFVGVDGAVVRYNTLVHPGRWAIRILQETRLPGFVPCRNGVFEDNLVVFRSGEWATGGVNIGDATEAKSFRFARNFWFCSDRPDLSGPMLPTPENGGTVGKDPLATVLEAGFVSVAPDSPARRVGAHAFKS